MNAADQNKVWDVRKAGLGLMMNVPGDAKPLPFVEDTAVAPEHLPAFVKRFDEIVKEHGTEAGYYGHASVGCLHIRPLVNLKNQAGVEKMESIAEQISDLVLEYGGSMSGEHGDGLVRSLWNRKMFGDEIYEAFRQVKRTFDPQNIMNPGKIIASQTMHENLRVGPAYSTTPMKSVFAFREEGSFAQAIEMCNGQGACRKVHGGTMCPSYMVTRDEEHSTRGRANALRAAMSGALPPESFTQKRLYETLDLCLECKGCKAECPSNVDMAKIKYEFLDKYHKANGYPLRNRLLANIAAAGRMGSMFAPLANLTMRSGLFKRALEKYAGIDRRRTLPPVANQTFVQWFRSRKTDAGADTSRGTVVLFPDTFTNYNSPALGKAAVKVMEHMGYRVVLPKVKCCGRPMMSKGMLEKARDAARFNVDSVYEYVRDGAKLVGIEPSCILSFKDEYEDLLGGDEKAREIAQNTMLIEEFVLHAQEKDGATLKFANPPARVVLHGHCHQKAIVGTGAAMRVLRSLPGCAVSEIPSGCCGMAGSFGLEKEHYDISMSIGEMTLFPAIRAQQGEYVLAAEGVSCRQQIENGTGKLAKHVVEVLADAI
jgi:anaerobic glycerol-3-phosphate dehydrogenase C subunit